MKVIFLGTPEFAVPILEALKSSKHEVVAVVTQPDRPKGRKLVLTPSPVKEKALQLNLPIYQPENVSDEAFIETLKKVQPDVAVVAAYGQIFRKNLLGLPQRGCWNVHTSLLPRYRGALPIERAILAGDPETGISIMKMGPGLDDGPVLKQVTVPISQNATAGEIEGELADLGAKLMTETLEIIESGSFELEEQDDTQASYAAKLKKEEALIHWNNKAELIHNQIRALNPHPGAYTIWNDKRLKIWRSEIIEEKSSEPGKVLRVEKELLWVGTASKVLSLKEVQLPGKKVFSIAQFLSGHSIQVGDLFTDVAPSV